MAGEGITADVDATTGVATVEFTRPPHNYFDVALIEGLADTYAELDEDDRARAIVLTSSGKHFCAGADFAGGGLGSGQIADLYVHAARLFSYGLPVVAAVQGRAVGGGLGLALSADFRVVTPETRLVCNFARLNLHHGFGLTVTLPAIVGQQRALELLYTGGEVRGEAAVEIGLAEEVATADELRGAAVARAAVIAASGPRAVRAIRHTMRGHLPAAIWEATQVEHREQAELFETEDFAEAVRASTERRPPVFTGR